MKKTAPSKTGSNVQDEKEAQKLAERLNLATRAAQMGIWDWDIQKNELVWDEQMYKLYGLKPDDFGGAYEAWLRGVHPDDRAPSNDASQQAVRGEKEYDTEFRVLWPDGSVHWLKANGQVFWDEKGSPLRMVGVNYDITARKQAEERLKESEEYLRLGYEAGDLGIWKNDLQTGAVEFDERARIHYGFDSLHTTLSEVTNRIHPDDLARVGSEIEAATSPHGSGKFATEYRVIHADGSVHWLAIGVQVRFEGEGAQRHAVVGYGTIQDITARKQAEIKLSESEQKFSALFNKSVYATTLSKLPDGVLVDVNEAFEQEFGYTRQEAIGKTSLELGFNPDAEGRARILAEIKERGSARNHELQLKTKSNETRLFSVNIDLVDIDGQKYILNTTKDITEQKRAEQALHESESSLKKSQAVAHVGHWSWDTQTNQVMWSDEMHRIFGVDPQTFNGDLNAIIAQAIHPEDREKVLRANEAVVSEQAPAPLEYRVIWPDDSVHAVLAIPGERITDENGSIVRLTGIVQDITERKRAENTLKESEEQFSKLFFTNPVSQAILSHATGKIVEVNDACCQLYGYSREELIGTAPNNLDLWANPADQPGILEELQRTGHLTSREVMIRRKSGEIHVILFSVEQNVWKGESCLITSSVDITERKQAEKQVTQMKRLYATLSQVNQTIVRVKDRADLYQSICDVSTKFGEFALAWIGLLNEETGDIKPVAASGLDLEKWPFPQINIHEGAFKNGLVATAMRTSKVVTSDDIAVDERTSQSQASFAKYDYHSTAIVPFQLRGATIGILSLVSKEAELFKAEDEILLLKEMGGDISFALDTMKTDAEHRQAETKIQRQLELIHGLHAIDQAISSNLEMESTLNIVLEQTLNLLKADSASILLFNDAQDRLDYAIGKGFRSASASQAQILIGEGLAGQVGLTRKLLHIPDLVQIGDNFLRAEMLKDDQFVEYFGVPLIAKDSLKGVLEIFNRTPTNPDSEWLNFLEILGGQTAIAIDNAQLFEELQQSNAELEQRVRQRTSDLLRVNAELEHANRTKDEFLATMSHELRTPLTGIIGLTESLLLSTYGQPNEKQSNALKNIESSGRHLLELINDILDLSKIESNKFDIYPELLDIEQTCRASLLFVKEQARKKSILLEYQEAKGVKSVFADPRRLKQILVNLLSNAVKFTPEKGRVTLAVRTDHEKGQIHFSITDTGIGVAKEDLDRLFTPFTQVDSRLNRQYEGTGLGLVLVLHLTEMHGGAVQVESEVGKGSTFTVSLPWQPLGLSNNQPPMETPASADIPPVSRGLILMAEDNPTNIEATADYLQFKGYTVVVANNGMEAILKAEEIAPDLILMDIQMPVLDGLEAMRRLRVDPRFAHTPIIALTALAMTGDRERCIAAGATEYLSKPVKLAELLKKIDTLLQK